VKAPDIEKAPAFQLYARDFLADPLVDAMEPEELGGYFRLLLIAWQQDDPGFLPNETPRLASWSKLGRRWKKHGPAIMACFRIATDGRIYQKRMVQVAADLRPTASSRRRRVGRPERLAAGTGTQPTHQPKTNRTRTVVQPKTQPDHQPNRSLHLHLHLHLHLQIFRKKLSPARVRA
jgi:uncharacterized protein YdaU (DUF1376 family)